MVGIDSEATVSMHQMSNNIVDVMQALSKNKGIRALLYIDDEEPFHPKNDEFIPTAREILDPRSDKRRISPVSFDMNAQINDRTEIRVYYNVGRFDSTGKHIDYNMHIDIICAKELWLIRDPIKGRSLIRPYELMSRVFDVIGHRNLNNLNIGRPTQFQMLSVNERFDAIRIYYNTRDISGNINSLRT